MKMTPALVFAGSFLIMWTAFFVSIQLPRMTMGKGPSEIWRPPTPAESRGRLVYISDGCTYCHSQYVRPQDWAIGGERIARPGDYYQQFPHLLGSERTGPDLSQEGGEHPDDWHLAHFANPRFTRPLSVMPRFDFHSAGEIASLIAYVQSLGGHDADWRVVRQQHWKRQAVAAHDAGPDRNIQWLHQHVPEAWRNMPNPYPPSEATLARGLRVYQVFCIGCHGPVGDGQGPAQRFLNPPPLNFTTLKRNLAQGKYIGGILYYQIMNGITGTDMPYFKKELESDKIWAVSNFVAVSFIGQDDSQYSTDEIPPAYEGKRPAPLRGYGGQGR